MLLKISFIWTVSLVPAVRNIGNCQSKSPCIWRNDDPFRFDLTDNEIRCLSYLTVKLITKTYTSQRYLLFKRFHNTSLHQVHQIFFVILSWKPAERQRFTDQLTSHFTLRANVLIRCKRCSGVEVRFNTGLGVPYVRDYL